MLLHTRAIQGRRLSLLLLVLMLAGCAPLRSYARTESIAQRCIAGDELRRGEAPNAGPGSPVPVTPADSAARSTNTAAEIKCNGGLSRETK